MFASTGAGASTHNVEASVSSTQICAMTQTAESRFVFNDSSSPLYLKFGKGAAPDSFTVRIPPGGYFEFPSPLYRGIVHGAWETTGGAARVTQVG